MLNNTTELLDRRMQCLVDNLGDVRAEEFISVIIREKFDYTKWHHDFLDNMSAREVNEAAAANAEKNPW